MNERPDPCRKNPKKAILSNILGTHNILESSQVLNVQKFIFSSSGAVYGSPHHFPITEEHPLAPTNIYGFSKYSGEMLVESDPGKGTTFTVILPTDLEKRLETNQS